MSIIVGEGVGKNYGSGYVFRDASFALEADDRVGLVGPNGQGKTTLVRILAGLEEPTLGAVRRRKALRIGYLPQETPVLPEATLWQFMLDHLADLRQMEADLRLLTEQLASPQAGEDLLKKYGALQHRFEDKGGYGYHARVQAALSGLGFQPHQYQAPLVQLSGGQRSRAILCGCLLTEPNLLLLDEPTNHLDLWALEWLERFLESFRGAMVVVSHDRYFLDKIAGSIWEVASGKLAVYRGNYSDFHRQRQERLARQQRRYQQQQESVARTEEFIRRNVGARRVGVAQGRRTRLERFLREQAVERPPEQEAIHLRFKDIARSGDMVFRTEGLVCGYEPGRPLVALPDVAVQRGARIAVIGGNGVGKTTLLRTLMGEVRPLAGQVRRGAKVNLGFLPQTQEDLDPEMTPVQAVLAADGSLSAEQARALLGGLLLSGEEALRRLGQLSGGQRSRVVLARLAARKANVLVLDEPTNHLDLPSQEVLQEVLAGFPGTVLLVTHDRYLVRALARSIWAIEDGRVHVLVGGWEEYAGWREGRLRAPGAAASLGGEAPAARTAHRQARRQANRILRIQRRQQELEGEIQDMESRIRQIAHRISQAGQEGDLDQVHRLGGEYQQSEIRLKGMWDEWTALTEELEVLQPGSVGQ